MQGDWSISWWQSEVVKPKVISHRSPAAFSLRVTYVYCWGKRPCAPGHDALKMKIIWIDSKQTMLQDLSPIAIFH